MVTEYLSNTALHLFLQTNLPPDDMDMIINDPSKCGIVDSFTRAVTMFGPSCSAHEGSGNFEKRKAQINVDGDLKTLVNLPNIDEWVIIDPKEIIPAKDLIEINSLKKSFFTKTTWGLHKHIDLNENFYNDFYYSPFSTECSDDKISSSYTVTKHKFSHSEISLHLSFHPHDEVNKTTLKRRYSWPHVTPKCWQACL